MSGQHSERLSSDRTLALRPKAVLLGVATLEQRREIDAIRNLCDILYGYFTEMQMDGADMRTGAGKHLLRMRAHVDSLEMLNGRLLHDRDGVIIE